MQSCDATNRRSIEVDPETRYNQILQHYTENDRLLDAYQNLPFHTSFYARSIQIYVRSQMGLPDISEIEIHDAENGSFYVEDSSKRRIISGLDGVLRILPRYGNTFSKIHFHLGEHGNSSWQQIFEHSDKYCSEVTKTITIRSNDVGIADWIYPFDKNMTTVIMFDAADDIPLNTIFPNMNELILNTKNLPKTIGQHFPHLTKCSIQVVGLGPPNPIEQEFIRLNPQLREFHTSMANNVSRVKYLNEHLPNLEQLTLHIFVHLYDVVNRENIHFKNVKDFRLFLYRWRLGNGWIYRDDYMEQHRLRTSTYRPFIGNITFEHLEALKLDIYPYGDIHDLAQMTVENQGLKKIDINVKMTQDQILKLIAALPKLEEVSLHSSRGSFN